MGHSVTGLVAAQETLQAFASRHALPLPIALRHGLALLPLRDDDLDALIPGPQDGHRECFTYLSAQLIDVLLNASGGGALVYFETDYHGGAGGQGAVAFSSGTVSYGPQWAVAGPINEALRLLGVHAAPPARDAFESVGLDRYRSTEDWLEANL